MRGVGERGTERDSGRAGDRERGIEGQRERTHMEKYICYIYEGCSKSKMTSQFSPATYIQVLNFCCCCVGTLVTIICSRFDYIACVVFLAEA